MNAAADAAAEAHAEHLASMADERQADLDLAHEEDAIAAADHARYNALRHGALDASDLDGWF